MKPLLTITLLLFSVATCFGFQTEADHCQRLAPKYHSKLEAGDTPAVRAYMIQNNNGRWLRRTIPGQINIWIVDQGTATIWVDKQEAHRVWASLGFLRDNAEIKTFLLVPVGVDE